MIERHRGKFERLDGRKTLWLKDTHCKKERLIIWCLAERHNIEFRKGITLPSKKWMHHLLKDILPNSIFDERRQLRFNTWNKNNTETYNLVRIEKLCSSAKSERHGEYNIVKWWKTILLKWKTITRAQHERHIFIHYKIVI